MKKITGIFLFLSLTALASEEVFFPEKAFTFAWVSLEGGYTYPLGSLRDGIEDSYYGLAEFRYNYRGPFLGFIQFGYSYVRTLDLVDFPGVHQFNGRFGLDYSFDLIKPLRIGGGFSCIWLRADGKEEEINNNILGDNESEFGWFVRVDLPVLILKNYRIGARLYGEQIWSQPERSSMIWFGFYFERRMW